MLIQNINSVASASGFTGNSGVIAASAHQTASLELPQVAVKSVAPSDTMQPTEAQLKNAVDAINKEMKQNNANVEFSIDKDTKQQIIKVVESSTGKVIRQFPSEEILAVSRMIGDAQHGLLLKQKA